MQHRHRLLCPRPQKLERGAGVLRLESQPTVELAGAAGSFAAEQLSKAMLATGLPAGRAKGVTIRLRPSERSPEPGAAPEGYRLKVDAAGVEIEASSDAGLFYGVGTLTQLLKLGADAPGGSITLEHVQITDQPAFSKRGVMLDISRDKVPTLETTLALVDLLASLKVNELQLYMEHTFAYAGHEQVWAQASPFSGAEIELLDQYCRDRHIELVPNQNSFGHMQRWLAFEPYRSELAEAPNGFEHAWNPSREPYGLCPTDARSLEFLNGLYDQLLPHFSSRTFNVGLDETFDLGLGRSQQACAELGTERVYLEFLRQIHASISRRGFSMQFWGDIILKRPELIPELPRDAIAMEWGYEDDHPFAEHVAKLAAAGLRFYVCPGTSSWNSIGGRTENALLNIASAVKHGAEHGALGVLNTDWGDNGHLQPLSVSYIGILAGAAMSWNAEDALVPLELPVAEWLDTLVLDGKGAGLGKLARDLGNAYRELGCRPHNASAAFYFVAGRRGQPLQLTGVEAAHFERTVRYLEELDAELALTVTTGPESERMKDELAWASDLLKAACRIGKARLLLGFEQPVARLPLPQRVALGAELAPLIERHRALWLRRNRPGGLADSAAQMERVLSELCADS